MHVVVARHAAGCRLRARCRLQAAGTLQGASRDVGPRAGCGRLQQSMGCEDVRAADAKVKDGTTCRAARHTFRQASQQTLRACCMLQAVASCCRLKLRACCRLLEFAVASARCCRCSKTWGVGMCGLHRLERVLRVQTAGQVKHVTSSLRSFQQTPADTFIGIQSTHEPATLYGG